VALKQIMMPQLAESVVEATITKWLKKPGDPIEKYEPICELITDKVNAELPSTEAGFLAEILVGEGQTVNVGVAICVIDGVGSTKLDGKSEAQLTPTNTELKVQEHHTNTHTFDSFDKARFSPAVRQMIRQYDLDVSRINGTGLGSRITRKDVLQYIELRGQTGSGDTVPVIQQSPPGPVRSSGLHLNDEPIHTSFERDGISNEDRRELIVDVTPVRSTIATRMRQSVSEIPHAWTMIEVDVTNLVALRQKIKEDFKRREGVNLTYLPFVIKAVTNAIKDYPMMNSLWAVDKIIVKRDINISLAVGTEDAVWVPVIKNAEQKSVAILAREIDELGRRARSGQLKLEDMQGGTFTINNTGAFGSMLSQPIINFPQAANLTFESIIKRPVVIQDMIAVRSMANICLSLDHRILDGVVCGRFLQRVRENIESYHPDSKLN
jgi:2-oxoisovalerate dehydrogenase E2 component (dihydrolipoyl transacylase)